MFNLDEAIKRYTSNAEYERTHGNLQGCLEFRQFVEWLKDYKRLLEQEPCEDAISRQEAIDSIIKIHPVDTEYDCTLYDKVDVMYVLKDLPPVTPKPETGHWTLHNEGYFDESYVCSKCDGDSPFDYKYCPNCGCRMVETQEKRIINEADN